MAATISARHVLRPRSPLRWLIYAILHSPVPAKILLLLAVLAVGSALHSLALSPATPLANRRNPLNLLLAKFSWGWTLLCVLPITSLVSFLYCALDWRATASHCARVGVAHVVWFCVTKGFDFFILPLGVDLSGHVFLLSYCVFVLTEEFAGARLEVWREFPATLEAQHRVIDKIGHRRRALLPRLHSALGRLVGLWELLAVAEVLLWVFLFVASCLYFHSFLEKLVAFGVSCLVWYLTYKQLYGLPLCPSRPTDAVLHPLHQFG